MSNNNQFQVGDIVVYPKNGVGHIEKIETLSFEDSSYQAFSIVLKVTGVNLMLPVKDAYSLGLRHIHPPEYMDKVFDLLSQGILIEELLTSKTWKDRKKVLEELFAIGTIENLVEIIKYLYVKNQFKLLPSSERRLYDFSLKFIIHEVSESKNISDEESEDKIAEILVSNTYLSSLEIH